MLLPPPLTGNAGGADFDVGCMTVSRPEHPSQQLLASLRERHHSKSQTYVVYQPIADLSTLFLMLGLAHA